MIQFSCACGKPLQAREEYAGQVTRCPQCGRELPIPGGEAVQTADAPRAAPPPPDYRRGRPGGPRPAPDWDDRGPRPPAVTTSGKAVTSMILGLLSVVVCFFFTGVPALILGWLGLRDVARGEGRVQGKGQAITGLVTGAVGTLLTTPLLIFLAIVPAYGAVREVQTRQVSEGNLKQMAIAMQDHHDATGAFPPAAVCDKATGKPLLSWRVALLPYVEQSYVYQQFNLNEPWDGPTNSRLVAQMPKVYALPGDDKAPPGYTYYRVFVGNGAAFDLNRGATVASFADGLSQTVLVAEAAEPVPWTKPDELPFDPTKPLPPLGGHYRYRDGFSVVLGDGSTRWIDNKKVRPQTLRAAITRNGGDVLGPDW